MDLRERTIEAIDQAVGFLADSPWSGRYLARVERLRAQVEEPCVLAVAGRVKAGKSTLINALLGQDLSLAGAAETTATINYFRFGAPEDPLRPVCCVWRNGHRTWESKAFLDSLQGTSEESLQRAESILHLEFYLPHPDLREVTLVDTPGTDAIVGGAENSHETVTARFFGMGGQLTERQAERVRSLQEHHSAETRRLAASADAVIYLVGQVAHVTNQEFLTEFQQASSGQTRALNALGVMSRIDLLDDVFVARHELANAIAAKLATELNTVVPVSAGLWRALSILKADSPRLNAMKEALCSIPADRFTRMLASDRAYLREYPDCAVPVGMRQSFMEGMPWRVFVIVARELRSKPVPDALAVLEEMSGFIELRRLLQNHFFRRGQLLRCFRILSDLHAILCDVRRSALYEYKQRIKSTRQDLLDFTDFIVEHPRGSSDVANRLRRFLSDALPKDNSAELDQASAVMLAKIERVRSELESVNQQFCGLQMLEGAPQGVFTDAELTELRVLFGLYATSRESDPVERRRLAVKQQPYWRQVQFESRDPQRKAVAELAQLFYGRQLIDQQ